MIPLGEKISALRAERGLSIKTLASEAGIGVSTVKRIEGGESYNAESLRQYLAALHRTAPLGREDAFEVAEASTLSAGALVYFLERLGPFADEAIRSPTRDVESWRARLHALADRMLARAPTPEQAEIAMVAIIDAFEALIPGPRPDAPMLTKRGEERRREDGTIERTDEHYYRTG